MSRIRCAVAVMSLLLISAPLFAQTPPPFGPPVNAGRTLSVNDMTNTAPLIPLDVYRSPAPSSQDLATFAWLSFISAVSPVNPSQRGTTGGSFASSGQNQRATLLWESYQHRSELFPFNAAGTGVPPQPWNSTPRYLESINNGNQPANIPFRNYNLLDETTQIGQNILFLPTTPGKPQPATDAQVLFEAKVNQYEWGFVNSNYKTLIPVFTPTFYLKGGITLPTGTVEVKAAWRPLSSIPAAQQYRYHISNAITFTGTDAAPVANVVPYALMALHIIHKSPNYPTFTFSTFEQIDDLTNQVTGQPSGVYYVPAYTGVQYTTPPTTTFPPFNQTVPNPTLAPVAFNPAAPTANPNGQSKALPNGNVSGFRGAISVGGGRYAIPVTQPVTITPGVQAVNNQAYAVMKQIPGYNNNFVWQYYKLAGIQAIPSSNDTTSDFYLANIVVESSQPGIQLFRGFPPIPPAPAPQVLNNIRNQVNVIDSYGGTKTNYQMGGCQGCHGIAQTQNGFDFSFLFFGVNGGGFSPETVGLPAPVVAATRVVNRKAFVVPTTPK